MKQEFTFFSLPAGIKFPTGIEAVLSQGTLLGMINSEIKYYSDYSDGSSPSLKVIR